eukprot:184907-Chlamydomonas_euryale.AAC.1
MPGTLARAHGKPSTVPFISSFPPDAAHPRHNSVTQTFQTQVQTKADKTHMVLVIHTAQANKDPPPPFPSLLPPTLPSSPLLHPSSPTLPSHPQQTQAHVGLIHPSSNVQVVVIPEHLHARLVPRHLHSVSVQVHFI